jgi:cytochrome P450
MCVGKALAYQEMRIAVCALMRRFEVQFAPGFVASEWENGLQDFLVTKYGQLPVTLMPREKANR